MLGDVHEPVKNRDRLRVMKTGWVTRTSSADRSSGFHRSARAQAPCLPP